MKSKQELKAVRVFARAFVGAMAIVALLASFAGAQVYYMYPGAPPVKKDEPAVGVNIGFGDKLFRTLGYGRFNVNSRSDLGIEVTADNTDTFEPDVWRFGLGADYKFAIVPKETEMPFDLAVDAGFGFQSGGDMFNINVPVGGVLSRPMELKGERVLVPYGGVYVLIQYSSWDLPVGATGDDSDWEVDVELRGGAGYEINKKSIAYASLFLGAGTKFYLGINFLL
jgi:hypothetical protein